MTFFRPEWLAFWAGVWVAILAFTILVIATNAGLIGISRLSYSMAVNDLFPGIFSRLHPRFRTPFVSILVFGVIAALLIVPAQIDLMAAVYSLAATFAFATAHLAVMRLRCVEPTLHRPFQMPLNIRFGRSSIPLLSVIGALAIGAVFTQLFFQNIQGSTLIYVGWLATGIVTFVIYRRHRKRSLWQPLAEPPPVPHTHRLTPAEERLGDLGSPRVHVGRRRIREAVAPAAERGSESRWYVPLRLLAGMRNPWQALSMAAGTVLLAVAVLAVLFDLSDLDPFGPGIGWSPGILLVTALGLIVLLRGRDRT